MKFYKYIIPLFALSLLGACSEDLPMTEPSLSDGGNTITVGVTLNVGDIPAVQSRAFTDDPDYNDLKLCVLEFKLIGNPIDNTLSRDYTNSIANVNLNGDGDIHFNITLDKIDEPRVLNFIAVPKSVNFDFDSGDGLEGSVIPGLTLDNSTPAYWQRIEFPNGYGTFTGEKETWTTDPNLTTTLDHIAMIRNFAKISMTVSEGAGFSLDGFALLNRPTKGTVAPWNSTQMKFPTFLTGKKMKSYATINAAYRGYSPFNDATDVWEKDPATATYDLDPKYIYERPHSSINSPVVIMRGRRTADGPLMYYKLDLGSKGENKLFEFYDILRNFEFAINVTKVGADGYATAQEALDGVVFNNLAFDISTRQMLNVSNGEDMLWVNKTTFVVTNDSETDVKFLYRFKTGISSGGGTVTNNSAEANGSGRIAFKDLVTGEAIENIYYGTADDADGWREVTIHTYNPTGERRAQDFIIYDTETGLGRTISIIVRNPWLYTDAGVWGGNYNYYEQFLKDPNKDDWYGYVSDSETIGQPLTVRFHIDDNIPEAMFPLKFTFESDRQNIENNKVGNLLVTYGPSYFGTGATTIKYVKTVTWLDYNSPLVKDNETGTIVDDDDDGITSHVVRARFQTILPIVTDEETIIRVYNPYMKVSSSSTTNYLDVRFRGKTGTAPDYESD